MIQHRHSRQRQLVLDAVLRHKNHPTADDIYIYVRKQDDKISRGTVYRNLNYLSEIGEIQQVKVQDAVRFDWKTNLHYHLKCIHCGKIFDLDIPYNINEDENVAERTKFKIVRHQKVFEGICPTCQESENSK